jgi:hypothetical protein
MTAEDAFKLILSTGNYVPPGLAPAQREAVPAPHPPAEAGRVGARTAITIDPTDTTQRDVRESGAG